MSAFEVASRVVTYGSAAVAWLFIVSYHLLSHGRWRRDPLGWHLMALAGVDAGIFTMLTVASLWPALAALPWFAWSYLCVVAGIAVVTGWRVVILWRIYHPRPAADETDQEA